LAKPVHARSAVKLYARRVLLLAPAYEPPEPYRKRYPGRPYDGEVAYADAQLGRLLDFLEREGLRGRTLVVLTSDHGEGLGDHGEEEHMMFLYYATLRPA
jgi:arylsulfatase A-like enzyme